MSTGFKIFLGVAICIISTVSITTCSKQAKLDREIGLVEEVSISFSTDVFQRNIEGAKKRSTERLGLKLERLFGGEKSGHFSRTTFYVKSCSITAPDKAVITVASSESPHIKLKLNLIKKEQWLVDNMGGD